MSVSLHTASVGAFLPILRKMPLLIDKAADHCAATGMSHSELLDKRLAPDMWPLAKQFALAANFSARCIRSVATGQFTPDISQPPMDLAALHAIIEEAIGYLEGLDPQEVEALADREMLFEWRDSRRLFTGQDFLLTYALPNFHFHTTTAYAILRGLGLNLVKGDWLGEMRVIRRWNEPEQ